MRGKQVLSYECAGMVVMAHRGAHEAGCMVPTRQIQRARRSVVQS